MRPLGMAALLIGSLVTFCPYTGILRADLLPHPNGHDLEYVVETDSTIYSLGQTVGIVHRVTNPLEVDVTLHLLDEPGFEVLVMANDDVLWSYPPGFAMNLWSLTLEPGEAIAYDYTWDMTDYDGNMLQPGEYMIWGMVHGDGHNVSTPISIIPEPGTVFLLCGGLVVAIGKRQHTRQSARSWGGG